MSIPFPSAAFLEPDDSPPDKSPSDGEMSFDGDERLPLSPLAATWDGDSSIDTRLRLLIEPMPAQVWTTDRELRFSSGMGGGLASFGLRAKPGTTLFDYYGTHDLEALPIRAHRLALAGESVSFEQDWEGRMLQTRVEPLRGEGGEILGCIGISVDVTERRQAQEALYREKERAQVTLASIGDGVIRTDPSGAIDYLNPVAERLTGWKAGGDRPHRPRGLPGGRRDHPQAPGRPGGPLPGRGEGRRVARPRPAAEQGRQGVLGARLGGAHLRPRAAPPSAPSSCSRTSPSSAAWSAR